MAEPGVSRNETTRWASLPLLGTDAATVRPGRLDPILCRARLGVRRLRYFRDLLAAGYRHALSPNPLSRSLRAERIALGIDVPELDAVPLWSVRRSDGKVSISFIEFILGQICGALDSLCGEARVTPHEVAEDLASTRRLLASLVAETRPAGEQATPLPRLRDIYVPGALLENLCGTGGLLDRTVQICERLVAEESPLPQP